MAAGTSYLPSYFQNEHNDATVSGVLSGRYVEWIWPYGRLLLEKGSNTAYLDENGSRGCTGLSVTVLMLSSNLFAQLSTSASSPVHRRCRTHAGARTFESLRLVSSRASTRVGGAMKSSKSWSPLPSLEIESFAS